MAEITTQAGNTRTRGGRRSKKLSTRIDLTPMVDLGFLLITFFIFTATMSLPHVTKLIMPADGPPAELGNTAALTVVPVAGNKLFYYNGDLQEALRTGSFGTIKTAAIGDIIRQKQAAMDRSYKGGRKEMMLLIKPSADANYGNVVALLDETLINDVKRYAIVDLTKEEKAQFSSKIL
jgi:biopolymer transport protein ExbD